MIEINEKYMPLYTSNDSLILIIGGRGSGKSFVVSDWACRNTYQKGEKILYTRYTLVSAKDSIIPEYKEKIELFKDEKLFNITEHEIINLKTNSSIIFKGIKTSSGNQKANLKSIKDPTKWVLDEAAEMPDYNTYQKIKRSLRKKGSKIQTILIFNPEDCDTEHWIYQKFFKENDIPDYFNGSKNGITYIHTTYLDNLKNLDETFLQDVETTKRIDKDEFEVVFLGKFPNNSGKVFFPKVKLNWYNGSEFDMKTVIGKNGAIDTKIEGDDYYGFIVGLTTENKTYIHDVIFNKDSYEFNEPKTHEKINNYGLQNVKIETNSAGRIFFNNCVRSCKNTSFVPKFNNVKKLTRIYLEQQYIIDNFVFRSDYEIGSDYDLFIKNLVSVLRDGTSKNDDAPDVCASLSSFLRRGTQESA